MDLAARSSMLWRLPAEDLEVVASVSALVGGLEFRLANGIPELRKISGDLGLLCNFLLLQGPVCKMGIVLFISLIYPPLRKNKKF